MGVREGYKQTILGEIPNDWIYTTFEEVLDGFSSGMTPYRGNPEFYTGNIRWISSGELNYNTIYDTIEKITEEAVRKTNLKILPKGTFLMAITGLEAAGTRGSCAIVGAESTTNQSCMALYPTEKMSIDYLYQFYVKYGNYLAFNYCQGTKQQSYTAKIVKKLPIILPPTKEEQQAIAQALSDTDTLIDALEKLIEKKRHIKQGAMQELLTGKRRLPGFNEKWNTYRIEDLFSVTAGGDLVVENLSDIKDSMHPYPIYANSIFNKGIYGYSSEKIYNGNKITVTARGTLGVAYYRPTPFVAIGRLLVLSPKGNTNCFLVSEIIDNIINFTTESTSVPQLTAPHIAKIEIKIPDINEQNSIATILTDMNSEIEALENKLQKTRELKDGMMHELLTGKTRLVKPKGDRDAS